MQIGMAAAAREGIVTRAFAELRQQIESLESQYDSTLRRIDEIEKSLASNEDCDQTERLTAELGERKKRFVEIWSALTAAYSRRWQPEAVPVAAGTS